MLSIQGHTEQLNLLQMEINKAGMQEEEDTSQSCKAVWQEEGTGEDLEVDPSNKNNKHYEAVYTRSPKEEDR